MPTTPSRTATKTSIEGSAVRSALTSSGLPLLAERLALSDRIEPADIGEAIRLALMGDGTEDLRLFGAAVSGPEPAIWFDRRDIEANPLLAVDVADTIAQALAAPFLAGLNGRESPVSFGIVTLTKAESGFIHATANHYRSYDGSSSQVTAKYGRRAAILQEWTAEVVSGAALFEAGRALGGASSARKIEGQSTPADSARPTSRVAIN